MTSLIAGPQLANIINRLYYLYLLNLAKKADLRR